VKIANDGPCAKVRDDHLVQLLVGRYVYTAHDQEDKRYVHLTQKGRDLIEQLQEGTDF
jgi:DNA-binding MarR family transcriptional regulator